MIKGEATLVFTDIHTGEVTRTIEQKNFIIDNQYLGLWTSNWAFNRLVIVEPGWAVYPIIAKSNQYFGVNANFKTGYAPTGKVLKSTYGETSTTPFYHEFYSLFLPPASTMAISCIGVVNYNLGDNVSSYLTVGDTLKTAINLNPPCYQSPTEYLNVYYRIIFTKDTEDNLSSLVKDTLIWDTERGDGKIIYPQDDFKMYPYRINEDTSTTGKLNYIPVGPSWSLPSKSTVHPDSSRNLALWHSRKTYTYPDDSPNQYKQINNGFVKSMIRGGRNWYDRDRIYLHPNNFIPDIGTGSVTGIGNVFATSATSNSPYFDPTYFPIGSGKMYATGTWQPEYQPCRYVAYITQTGMNGADARYILRKYHGVIGSHWLPLLPNQHHYWSWTSSIDTDWLYNTHFLVNQRRMFREPNKISYSNKIRTFEEERSFITWNNYGITIYDIYMGKLIPLNFYTTPLSMATTDVRDVKVDSNGFIWVACGNTGLWKIEIIDYDIDTAVVTHIGELPASRQKCYAIDCDNFGNVWAVFWGQGLYYTTDSGATWINAIINYSPFSSMDTGGTDSQWRFCSRIVCNPHLDASQLEGQVLLTIKTTTNNSAAPESGTTNGAVTAGCWYDLETASTTAITGSTLRTMLTKVRDDTFRENIDVSSLTGKWVFNDNGNNLAYTTFGTSSGWNALTGNFSFQGMSYCVHVEKIFDISTGTYKDYALNGPHIVNASNQTFNSATNLHTNAVEIYGSEPTGASDFASSTSYVNSVRFGKNQYIYFRGTIWESGYRNAIGQNGYCIARGFPPSKEYAKFTSTTFGWDGSNWVKDYLGTRECHTTAEPLENGISLRFENGPVSTTSFSLNDQYTFTCFDGFFKDNSSKMTLADTVYFKPKQVITTFDPPVVTYYDKSGTAGLVNGEINTDWNIDQLPDTVYEGSSVVLGDTYYAYTPYVNWLYNANFAEAKYGTLPSSVIGTTNVTTSEQLFGNDTTYFDGESGLYYATSASYSFGGSNFTLEGWFKFEEVGVYPRVLWDFRGADSDMGVFYINAQGNLVYNSGSADYGASGTPVQVGVWHHIAFVRVSNSWYGYLDGVQQWSVTLSTAFAASRPMYLGCRWALSSSWTRQNLTTIQNNSILGPMGTTSADAMIANATSATEHGVYRHVTVTTGQYTFSVYVKKGQRRYVTLRSDSGSSDRRLCYDFDTDTFVATPGGVTATKEVLSGGWVRLGFTVTETTAAISRYWNIIFSSSSNPSTAWAGDATNVDCYVWGAQLETGNIMTTYEASGSTKNLFSTDSEDFYGSRRGFRGWASNIRLTRTIARYTSNFSVPTAKFNQGGDNFTGARLKLAGQYNEGAIICKRELVGDWEVRFHNINTIFKTVNSSRPRFAFGISPTRTINYIGDLGWRWTQGSDSKLRYENWRGGWGTGHNLYYLSTSTWMDLTIATTIRYKKVGLVVTVSFSIDFGVTWNDVYQITTYDAMHFIGFYQWQPIANTLLPAVEIVSNGGDYISKVGDPNFATGFHHPKFLCVDNYWGHDWNVYLDGVKTGNRSNFTSEGAPLVNQNRLGEYGIIAFNAADVGKTITGSINALRN